MFSHRTLLHTALVVLLALSTATAALAQNRGGNRAETRALGGTVSGTVVEAATEAPIVSATAALWNAADSSLVTGAITADDGTFSIDGVRPGQYYLRVSFVGYRPQTFDDLRITPQNRIADLGTIAMDEDTEMLDGVEVTAERSFVEVGIDKTSYNVENQPMTAGG